MHHSIVPCMMARRMTMTKKKKVMSKSNRRNSCWSPLADIRTSARDEEEEEEEEE